MRKIAFLWIVLLIVSCQNSAEPVSAPTVIAETGETQWTYVALGNSMTWGVQQPYAAHMEADLGASVTVYDETQSAQAADGVIAMLQNRPIVQAHLAEADVVSIVAGGGPNAGYCFTGRGEYPFWGKPFDADGIAAFRADYDAMFDELLKYVDPRDTLIRATNYYNPLVAKWQEWGVTAECKEGMETYNQQIAESAAAHNILLVDIYSGLNGPNGDEDLGAKGLLRFDGIHLNEQGGAIVANLLQAAGYTYAEGNN